MTRRLDTERVVLRPFTAADAEAAFAWFGDSEVMQYIPGGADATVEQTRQRIARYLDHEQRHGFSKWLVIERASGAVIGDAGYYFMPDGERVELGYRLARACWGQGLATEIAAAWLSVAHAWYGLSRVFAYCHPEHAASQRVLQRLGFEFSGYEAIHGWSAPVYFRETSPA